MSLIASNRDSRPFGLSKMVHMVAASGSIILASSAMAEQIVFEGVPWGATQSQVREVLGDRVKLKSCTDAQRAEQASRANARSCDSLYIEDYTIDGISFLAFFNMGGPGQTLNTVYLDRVATVTNKQIKDGEGADYRYNRVKKELAGQYGSPAEVKESETRPSKEHYVLHTKWIVDDTVISLTDMIMPDPRGQMYYLGVVYKPLAEAMKPLPNDQPPPEKLLLETR